MADAAAEIAKAIKDIEQVRLLLRGQPDLGAVLTLVAERLRHLPPQPIVTDAAVAREFFRRFGPVKVTLGTWRGIVAHAEEYRGGWFSAALATPGDPEKHADGEDGFVVALERARSIVSG